jgi:hypothetical protein
VHEILDLAIPVSLEKGAKIDIAISRFYCRIDLRGAGVVSLLNCAEVLERVILGHDRPILEDASSAIRGNSFTDLASSTN